MCVPLKASVLTLQPNTNKTKPRPRMLTLYYNTTLSSKTPQWEPYILPPKPHNFQSVSHMEAVNAEIRQGFAQPLPYVAEELD